MASNTPDKVEDYAEFKSRLIYAPYIPVFTTPQIIRIGGSKSQRQCERIIDKLLKVFSKSHA